MQDKNDANPAPEEGSNDPGHFQPQTQEVQHSQISALVPDNVARGAFSTGAVVLNGTFEFIIDFLLRMTKPHRVAVRVVLPPPVVPRFIVALRENIENYKKRFGPIPPPPVPTDQKQQSAQSGQTSGQTSEQTSGQNQATSGQQVSAQELYEQLKFPDDEMSGVYANAVMIGHSATEFSFDFITTFFPRSVVSSRVYLSAPNVPRLLESLTHSYGQYERKLSEQQQQQQRPPAPPADSPENE